MLPTVTIVMMNLGFVMSGAILSEAVFNWPGSACSRTTR